MHRIAILLFAAIGATAATEHQRDIAISFQLPVEQTSLVVQRLNRQSKIARQLSGGKSPLQFMEDTIHKVEGLLQTEPLRKLRSEAVATLMQEKSALLQTQRHTTIEDILAASRTVIGKVDETQSKLHKNFARFQGINSLFGEIKRQARIFLDAQVALFNFAPHFDAILFDEDNDAVDIEAENEKLKSILSPMTSSYLSGHSLEKMVERFSHMQNLKTRLQNTITMFRFDNMKRTVGDKLPNGGKNPEYDFYITCAVNNSSINVLERYSKDAVTALEDLLLSIDSLCGLRFFSDTQPNNSSQNEQNYLRVFERVIQKQYTDNQETLDNLKKIILDEANALFEEAHEIEYGERDLDNDLDGEDLEFKDVATDFISTALGMFAEGLLEAVEKPTLNFQKLSVFNLVTLLADLQRIKQIVKEWTKTVKMPMLKLTINTFAVAITDDKDGNQPVVDTNSHECTVLAGNTIFGQSGLFTNELLYNENTRFEDRELVAEASAPFVNDPIRFLKKDVVVRTSVSQKVAELIDNTFLNKKNLKVLSCVLVVTAKGVSVELNVVRDHNSDRKTLI